MVDISDIPSGNDYHSYWKWPSRNSEFSHYKLCFIIVILVYQRVLIWKNLFSIVCEFLHHQQDGRYWGHTGSTPFSMLNQQWLKKTARFIDSCGNSYYQWITIINLYRLSSSPYMMYMFVCSTVLYPQSFSTGDPGSFLLKIIPFLDAPALLGWNSTLRS